MQAIETEQEQAKHEAPAPQGEFFELRVWAQANSIGINACYEFCRRTIDPIPHIKIGRKYLIDNTAGLAWLRRKFGSGCSR